ncbi:MAG: MFS transporter [Acidimicrobiales bacterium]
MDELTPEAPSAEDAAVIEAPTIWSGGLLPVTLANLTIVALAAFDGLAVTAALPSIAEDLGDVGLLPWVITAYYGASAIAVIVAGPLIDGFGVRRTFRLTVVWFLVTSLMCAFAPNLPLLVAARTAQGLGGGLVITVAFASVGLAYPTRLRARAFAANSLVWGTLGLGGPALAGVVLEVTSWRIVFLLQVPLTAAALVAGWTKHPRTRLRPTRPHVDVVGIVLLVALTLITLIGFAQVGVRWWAVGVAAASSVLLVAAYWAHAGRSAEPVLLRRHLAATPIRFAHLTAALVLTAGLCIDSYLPLYINLVEGRSIGFAAATVVFLTIGWSSGSVASSRLLDHYSEAQVIMAGSSIMIPALVGGAAFVFASVPMWWLFGTYVITGLSIGLVSTSGLTLLQKGSVATEIGRVNAAHQFVRTLGITYGVALGGSVLLFVVARRTGDVEVVRSLLAGDEAADVAGATRDAVASGLAWAHVAGAVVAVAALAAAITLLRHSPSDADDERVSI